MSTAAHSILGYTGTLGRTISARRRREPKYSKQQQANMIRAILSRRMMSPPSYEDILDYVDTEVTYAENKREVLAVFGERTRKARVNDKEMREMYCTSLHNECAANGLDTCQTACDECKNPAACKKAERIGKEIKKHGRELSALERTMIYTAKEEKRAVKKAKFSVGQTVKCREGYELQCGFSGAQKITQVKRYPDYVMYGIRGKVQGFVEEEWIVGVKVKTTKPLAKGVKKHKKVDELNKKFHHHSWWRGQGLTKRQALDKMAERGDFYIGKKPKPNRFQSSYLLAEILYDDIIKYSGREGGTYKISPAEKEYFLRRRDYHKKRLEAENARIRADPKHQLQKQKEEEQDLIRNVAYAKRELESAKKDNDTHRIEYWAKAIQEKKQQLTNFYTRTGKKKTVKPKKPVLKEKKKGVRYAKKKGGTSKADTRKVVIEGICPVCGSKLPEALTHTWDDYATLEVHCSHCKTRFFCDTNEGAEWSCDITKYPKEIKKFKKVAKVKTKPKKKVQKEPKMVELGRDIPRWVKIKNKKYFFSRSFPAKKEADNWAEAIRNVKRLAHVKKYNPFIFYLSSSKTPQRYIVWATSPYEVEEPPKLRPAKAIPKKVKKAKPPKPTPTKTAPKKKKNGKKPKPSVKPGHILLPKKQRPSKIVLHPKTLTDAQIKHARKHGYVNVTIDGVKKRVTKRNYAPRKRTVQWYRRGGKVCLKVRG